MNDHELAELRRLVRQQDERLLRLENQLRGVGRSRTGFSAGPGVNVIGQDTEIDGDLTVSGAIHGTADAAESVPWAGVTDKPSVPTKLIAFIHPATGLAVGSHVFTRAAHFPNVPAGVKAITVSVLWRWLGTPSANTRAILNADGSWYIWITNTLSGAYFGQTAKVYLSNESFTVVVEGEDMASSYIILRDYEM